MNTEQYQRLPALARLLVEYDRAIAAEKAEPLVDLLYFRALRDERRDFRRSAASIWGAPIRGDGPAGRA
jgi:hypothetical protein